MLTLFLKVQQHKIWTPASGTVSKRLPVIWGKNKLKTQGQGSSSVLTQFSSTKQDLEFELWYQKEINKQIQPCLKESTLETSYKHQTNKSVVK